jgi:glycosyltransferase involved in cell wall biosynthesis
VLRLPHHVSLPFDPLPTRAEARRALGLPADAAIVTAPGLATRAKRLEAVAGAVGRLRARHPGLRLVVAGGVEEGLPLADWARAAGLGDALIVTGRLGLGDFVRHLVAADVVATLRFPSRGEMSGALVRALGVGRPVLVSAGTPAAEEFPEGCVVPVDPGVAEAAHLDALLARLLGDAALREAIGALAQEHVAAHHDLAATVERLADFLEDVHGRRPALTAEFERRRLPDGTLAGFLGDEARWAARDLGLADVPPEVESLLAELSK